MKNTPEDTQTGAVYKTNFCGEIYNLRKFCIENGLNYTSLNEVKLGRKKLHKGWTVAG